MHDKDYELKQLSKAQFRKTKEADVMCEDYMRTVEYIHIQEQKQVEVEQINQKLHHFYSLHQLSKVSLCLVPYRVIIEFLVGNIKTCTSNSMSLL